MRISDWSSDVCSSDLQADRQLIARFEQELAAHAPTVAVVDVLLKMKVAGIAVAAVVVAADRDGDGVADRDGGVALDDDRAIIAIARLERAAAIKLRLLSDGSARVRSRSLRATVGHNA